MVTADIYIYIYIYTERQTSVKACKMYKTAFSSHTYYKAIGRVLDYYYGMYSECDNV